MLKHTMRHQRVLTFKFIGPTNTRPSRVAIKDTWHAERVELSLSGADMMETVVDHLESRGFDLLNYGFTKAGGDEGVIIVNDFAKRIK